MRKQDRIAQEQQNRKEQQGEAAQRPERDKREDVKGSGADESRKPERPSGKLPLPD